MGDPEGLAWPDRENYLAAAEEAREEAGVLGLARAECVGSYTYQKRRSDRSVPVVVLVYLLEVQEELANWPEKDQRDRGWFELSDAAIKVDEPELRQVLLQTVEIHR